MILHDYMFDIGVIFIDANQQPIHLPESVGRMTTSFMLPQNRGSLNVTTRESFVPCDQAFLNAAEDFQSYK